MKNRITALFLTLGLLLGILPLYAMPVSAVEANLPAAMWVEASEANGLPIRVDAFFRGRDDREIEISGSCYPEYKTIHVAVYEIYLPASVDVSQCFLSWDNSLTATVGGTGYASGACPIPAVADGQQTYVINDTTEFKVTTYQGSPSVPAVFIDIDESKGTIAAMDGDLNHNTACTGRINIGGQWYEMPKMKGRGNATWTEAKDKKPYNITLGAKIQFPGVDSEPTKKWSFLAENLDHSLLGNRAGYHLAYELGIGQDTASADVWMNGEYQGCYTVTPKTDSFVTKNGYMIEQDNYQEPAVADGGDPQFALEGLITTVSGWSSVYNLITVKKMGDNLLKVDGVVDESPENMEAVAAGIQTWLQAAWDAIRSEDGCNSEGKYYTDYIDVESFAKMYLVHEYVKSYDICAGSILFHRDGQGDGDKLIAGPLWDLDNAMGSIYQNSSLGKADDRKNGDRRLGYGDFIINVTEYKTSIYKTIGKHEDFMEEVYHQYNVCKDAFDGLEDDLEEMADEIEESAMMNFAKVQDLGHDTGKNNHYYSEDTTVTTSVTHYSQTFLGTTDNKTDWSHYVENMRRYVEVRSEWFQKYYDPNDPVNCEHTFADEVVPPTCTEKGYTKHTCTNCGTVTQDSFVPPIPHDYQDGVCTVCGEVLLDVDISCSPGASVTVYETQDLTGPSTPSAALAHPRDPETGRIDCAGEGQVNFTVELTPGYVLDSVTAAPNDSYNKLKGPNDTLVENGYRLTKVSGDVTVTVAAHCTHDYSETVTPPTCTEAGYTTHTCAICGDVYTDSPVDALGHDYVTSTIPPTLFEQGYDEHVCTRCGDTCRDSYTGPLEPVYADSLRLKSATLTLENSIAINFYVADSVLEGWDEPFVVFCKARYDQSGKITGYVTKVVTDFRLATSSDGTECHVFTFPNVSAKEMGSEVTATLYGTRDGTLYKGRTVAYSVLRYATNMLAKTKTAKLRTLLVDLLNYGAAAQAFFGYNTANPANAGLTATQRGYGTQGKPSAVSCTSLTDPAEATVTFRRCSLNLEEVIAINFYLNLSRYSGDIDDLELRVTYTDAAGTQKTDTVDGATFELRVDGNEQNYIAKLSTLKAKQMRIVLTAEVFSKSGDCRLSNTLTYSIESYVKSMQSSSNETLVNLVDCVLKYGDSAYRYFPK